MKNLIFFLVVIFLLTALSATARKKEPVPVYIEKPPINRPRTMSIPDRNRLYKMNNQPIEISKETKAYLKTLEDEKESE